MTTAAAPCACPNCARWIRAQTPRSVTTILPAICESTYSDSLQPSEMLPSELRSTTMGSGPLGTETPFESCSSMLPSSSLTRAPG
jgi:hypothetical protein